jgi:SAM-dependent methyltransferase
MKRFSDLTTDAPTSEPTVNNEIAPSVASEMLSDTVADFPEYLVNDPIVLGYAYEETQYSVYDAAQAYTIRTGYESILDVGCGRGDFGNHLLKQFPNIQYTGIDLNPLLVDVGKQKYSEISSNFILLNQAFTQNYPTDFTYDWVFHVTDLTLDYGVHSEVTTNPLKRYEMLEWNIIKSLEISKIGCVFMLLNDKDITEGYLNYSFSPITEILYRLNAKFAFDNSDLPNVTKLVVLKESF